MSLWYVFLWVCKKKHTILQRHTDVRVHVSQFNCFVFASSFSKYNFPGYRKNCSSSTTMKLPQAAICELYEELYIHIVYVPGFGYIYYKFITLLEPQTLALQHAFGSIIKSTAATSSGSWHVRHMFYQHRFGLWSCSLDLF